MSVPWWHPEANPLRDVREAMERMERQYLAAFALPPPAMAPELTLHCPACRLPRALCLQVFGRDPVHEDAIRAALRLEGPPDG